MEVRSIEMVDLPKLKEDLIKWKKQRHIQGCHCRSFDKIICYEIQTNVADSDNRKICLCPCHRSLD